MNVSLAVRTLPELTAHYGPMRTLLHHKGLTSLTLEQRETYELSIARGEVLRESRINYADGDLLLRITCVKYIDPESDGVRYAVDYMSPTASYLTRDHSVRGIAEVAYIHAVLGEFAAPTLDLSRERFSDLASFYDVTDVI
ncbi:hypothetical protein [Streptomyces sp. SP18BB07]|uniref:hypothetical protein n=1 Tax=Streptomyces sp. SP18BB07 TaxID=3002522 RepID=UPI002E79A60A|nr:hypothetical protein [Streptomyces sp. SP18BB07]MEE1764464.1 hypothetical protein [Streptomyces sp. SP18BB07]